MLYDEKPEKGPEIRHIGRNQDPLALCKASRRHLAVGSQYVAPKATCAVSAVNIELVRIKTNRLVYCRMIPAALRSA